MSRYHAQPYDLHAKGFYFDDGEEFKTKMANARNEFGEPVEEFEIQFIDGDDLEYAVSKAIGIYQSNIDAFITAYDQWDDDDKIKIICAVGECGYNFDINKDAPERLEVDVYHDTTLKELAEQFVDDGLFGDIPESAQSYIDFDAIARDLAMDYSETDIAGNSYVYRCG